MNQSAAAAGAEAPGSVRMAWHATCVLLGSCANVAAAALTLRDRQWPRNVYWLTTAAVNQVGHSLVLAQLLCHADGGAPRRHGDVCRAVAAASSLPNCLLLITMAVGVLDRWLLTKRRDWYGHR